MTNQRTFEPMWMNAMLEDFHREVKEEAQWPMLLLRTGVRHKIWSLCTSLAVCVSGIPACACLLLEQYLWRAVRRFLQTSEDLHRGEWERYKKDLEMKFPLLMVSCVMLAAKMNEAQAPVKASSARIALSKHGDHHTHEEIIQTEITIYKTLEFRLPLWTTTDMTNFLAWHVGVYNPMVQDTLSKVIDRLEYNRNHLEKTLNRRDGPTNVKDDSPQYSLLSPLGAASKSTVKNLHLSAGAVYAAARLCTTEDPVEQLATLTRTTTLCIIDIGKVAMKLMRKDDSSTPAKRPRLE